MPTYDVFISHASEDKDFAGPLAKALENRGLKVWYDMSEIQIGDSLRGSIDDGLTNSRFGVVVLSPSFLPKNWTKYELDGLLSRQMTGERVILPIWHRLTADDIMSYSPSITDIVSLNSSSMTLEQIADEIAGKVGITDNQTGRPISRESSTLFGVFYIASAYTPVLDPEKLPRESIPYFESESPEWISVTSRNEELEYRLEDGILRLRLSYGNTYAGREIEAAQMLSSGQPFAITIISRSRNPTYFPLVSSSNPSSWLWGQQSRSGWMTFKIG